MGKISFENFGKKAELLNDSTLIAGRYFVQKDAEKLILLDLIHKLTIIPNDECLDIGCGPGNLLIPLSFFVKKVTGIDHSKLIEKLKKKLKYFTNIELISGNFLDLTIKNTYSKIIVYSVLQYLEDREEVIKFIEKTLFLLKPRGKVIFGDLPNKSKKQRFLSSVQGKVFLEEWEFKRAEFDKKCDENIIKLEKLPKDNQLVEFDDDFIINIIEIFRNKGYNAYIHEQKPELPFGNTREDILIEKPNY